VSRLTDLIAQVKKKDATLGTELEREFNVLSGRRAFGLNFERHRPESVELPGRPVRKGDKVRVLPLRGSTKKGDQRLWRVLGISEIDGKPQAHVSLIESEEPEEQYVPVSDVVVVAEFRDFIYPGLISTGKVERGGDKPCHTVINGENFHVLEALTFTHRGKIDAIYIDPPYNTGAKDWKYNNDYVEGEDLYRHSKWLAFMERRLLIAKQLLNPTRSALIVTIDEKEYLRLGLLLEQTFPSSTIQMISSVIAPQGQQRPGQFSRVEEYLFFVLFGERRISHTADPMIDTSTSMKKRDNQDPNWDSLIRRGTSATRSDRPGMFYPIFVRNGEYAGVGEALPLGADRTTVKGPGDAIVIWPIRTDGSEGRWQVGPERIAELFDAGYARIGRVRKGKTPAVMYLKSGEIERIESEDEYDNSSVSPRSMWNRPSHNAGSYGSTLLRTILPERRFPFPKSLYAVEDSLRFVVSDNPNAIVLDFFSGSGTTAHAIMRLNRQDGGRRQCISVTNNEVSADEQSALRKEGLRPGDHDWEKWGICEYITKPRITAAITGKTPDGDEIKGDYKFVDEFPMSEGFEENAEFFTLTYESPIAVSHNLSFQRITALLWMRAGSEGRRIDTLPEKGWDVADTYGLLTDLDQASAFCNAVNNAQRVRIAFIVTDDERRFQAVTRHLPQRVEPVRLYESYLTNFRFSMGR
jgi:adenine-specific DNA-methyltransferase